MGSCLSSHPSHSTSFNGDDAGASSHISFGMPSGSKRWKDIKAKASRKRKQKKKEKARRTYDDLDELCRISGRMFVNGSSDVACLFTQQGKKGTNQDAMIVWEGYDLVIGNVGDSRAILGRRDTNNNLIAEQLTVDLKPNLPKEAARIQQCNGRVFALQDEPEVARVWLPNNDSPGLAMARAFGDFCLKDYGLISVPDISYRLLTDKDEFIVLATDGIWDVLSNKEVVDIIASAPTRATAARALVECAVRSWRLKYPTSKTDDCAAVCLFLNSPSISTHQTTEPIINKTHTNQEVEIEVKEQAPTSHEICEVHDGEEEDEIVPVQEEDAKEKMPGRSQSARSLADCMQATDEEEWSALEGVTRVNTLLNIPRFLPKDKGSTSRGK